VLVFGALARKQAAATLAPLAARAAIVLHAIADADEASAPGAHGVALAHPEEALAAAVERAEALGTLVLVAGSLHLAGRARPWLSARAADAGGAGGAAPARAVGPEADAADAGAMLGGRWDASGSSA
jgi:folylpolyglutamate synthase/dihydropteroate synthase